MDALEFLWIFFHFYFWSIKNNAYWCSGFLSNKCNQPILFVRYTPATFVWYM